MIEEVYQAKGVMLDSPVHAGHQSGDDRCQQKETEGAGTCGERPPDSQWWQFIGGDDMVHNRELFQAWSQTLAKGTVGDPVVVRIP